MNFIWWILWISMILWVFAVPYEIPGQRSRKETALDILNKRYARGEISKNEYLDLKSTIETK